MNSDENLNLTVEELSRFITTTENCPFFLSNFIKLFKQSHRADKCVTVFYDNYPVPHFEIIQHTPKSYPTRAQRIQLALIQCNIASCHNKFLLDKEIISFKDIKEEREFNSQVYIHFYGKFKYTNIRYLIMVMENKITLQFYLNRGKCNDNN